MLAGTKNHEAVPAASPGQTRPLRRCNHERALVAQVDVRDLDALSA
jgi:hypothetical protein